MKKLENDVILQFCTLVVFFVIVMFSFATFMGGHYGPGGGFVGGLLISGALILILIAYDIKTFRSIFKFDFKKVIALGLTFCYAMPLLSIILGKPFFTHKFGEITLPIIGTLHLHTAVLFDTGVMLAVIGTVMTIILTIGEND